MVNFLILSYPKLEPVLFVVFILALSFSLISFINGAYKKMAISVLTTLSLTAFAAFSSSSLIPAKINQLASNGYTIELGDETSNQLSGYNLIVNAEDKVAYLSEGTGKVVYEK